MILAGDIGGTKTLLSLFKYVNNQFMEIKSKKYKSIEFDSFENIIENFVENDYEQISSAAFGIPGPVENGKVKSTNLSWTIDENNLKTKTGIPLIKLVNDLAATAYEIPYLDSEEVISLKDGIKEKSNENFVVVAPGTGLGQAFLVCDKNQRIVIPSEGGHADFAPTNELEQELYVYLSKKFKRVSYERIISGSGLPNIFNFLIESKFAKPQHETLERMKKEDKAALISELGLNKKDEICEKTLDIFVSVLGAHCGNLVITLLAKGGVYLGGGIPHKILPKLKSQIFINSFNDKGRLRHIVESTPVYVINNNNIALRGAARIALSLIEK